MGIPKPAFSHQPVPHLPSSRRLAWPTLSVWDLGCVNDVQHVPSECRNAFSIVSIARRATDISSRSGGGQGEALANEATQAAGPAVSGARGGSLHAGAGLLGDEQPRAARHGQRRPRLATLISFLLSPASQLGAGAGQCIGSTWTSVHSAGSRKPQMS